MRVFLVRHAEACSVLEDPERPLTPAGREAAGRLAQWCLDHGVAPQQIRHSGVLRAAQTAEILAARLAPEGGVRAVRGLAPDDDPVPVAEDLTHETRVLMLVTHLPFVGELASLLLTGSDRLALKFSTGTIACIGLDASGFRLDATFTP